MNLIDNIVSKQGLVSENDKIVVGVSGGADSIALLHFLKFHINAQVAACHINHNLRGEESLRDKNFVIDICAKWDIQCVVFDEDITKYARKNGISIEQAGREIRYARFEQTRKSLGYEKIATAHTLSDNIETFIFNLSRGAGLDGLSGIPSKRSNIVRPFINITRTDVENYCAEEGIDFVNDSTNFQDEYTRNKIRLNIISQLKKINPRFEQKVGTTINMLCEDRDYINAQAKKAYNECYTDNKIDVSLLKQFDDALAKRVIMFFLKENAVNFTSKIVEKILSTPLEENLKINVSTQKYIVIKSQLLSVEQTMCDIKPFCQELKLGEMELNNGKSYNIYLENCFDIKNNKKIYKNLFYICLDYGKIYDKLFLRSRREADTINLINRGGTKTVKKIFTQYKLNSYEKSSRFLLTDGKNVLAIEGIGVDKNVKITEETQTMLVIETIKSKEER
ncbi:MAG: tRNA lysidine(34) synthetase TilS [Oscillospiraceae bacterium]